MARIFGTTTPAVPGLPVGPEVAARSGAVAGWVPDLSAYLNSGGHDSDDEADDGLRAMVEQQIESESLPKFLSGRLYDDGVIDPRDTRTVLGIALSACHSGEVKGTDSYGVFRM